MARSLLPLVCCFSLVGMTLSMPTAPPLQETGDTFTFNWSLVPEEWYEVVVALTPLARASPPLDGLDVFSGCKHMATSMYKASWAVLTFEKLDDDVGEDILTDWGISHLVWMVLRVKRGGLVFLGPPCKSWIFLTCPATGRTKLNPAGRWSSKIARLGNKIADMVSRVIMLCTALGIFWIIEQPMRSLMHKFQPIHDVNTLLDVVRTSFPMAAFGHHAFKQTVLWGTTPWLKLFGEHARRLPIAEDVMTLANHDIAGGVTGDPEGLEDSAKYPPAFCELIVLFHSRFLERQAWCGEQHDGRVVRRRHE